MAKIFGININNTTLLIGGAALIGGFLFFTPQGRKILKLDTQHYIESDEEEEEREKRNYERWKAEGIEESCYPGSNSYPDCLM